MPTDAVPQSNPLKSWQFWFAFAMAAAHVIVPAVTKNPQSQANAAKWLAVADQLATPIAAAAGGPPVQT